MNGEGPGGPAADDRILTGPVLERAAYVRAVLRRNAVDRVCAAGLARRDRARAAVGRLRGPDGDGRSGAAVDRLVDRALRLGPATVSQRLPWPGKLSLDEAVAKAEADAANDATTRRRAASSR